MLVKWVHIFLQKHQISDNVRLYEGKLIDAC